VRKRTAGKPAGSRFRFLPATAARWKDLQTLFGPNGACAGCWCMWFRLPSSEWAVSKGDRNKRAMGKLIRRRIAPGDHRVRGY
jgi:hypothetical protein